jgi:hypothetical protein
MREFYLSRRLAMNREYRRILGHSLHRQLGALRQLCVDTRPRSYPWTWFYLSNEPVWLTRWVPSTHSKVDCLRLNLLVNKTEIELWHGDSRVFLLRVDFSEAWPSRVYLGSMRRCLLVARHLSQQLTIGDFITSYSEVVEGAVVWS